MYRWQIFVLLLLSIGGVISMTLGSTLQVFSVPLATLDVGSYCDRLESALGASSSSIIVLQIGRPSVAYEVVAGNKANTTNVPGCEFFESDTKNDEEDTSANERLLQQIHDIVIAVKSRRIVEYITVLTVDGEYLLTIERTRDFEEPLSLTPKYSRFSGYTETQKVLLSLSGGGQIKSFLPVKKP